MVVDAAKGVEAQTIKLLEVCRLRNTPIITFINKLDREVREPLELLDEIESVLKIDCAPVTWPIGMGKRFRGVYHLINDEVLRFAPGEENADQQFESMQGLAKRRSTRVPAGSRHLLRRRSNWCAAPAPFHLDDFLAGQQTPVFFGSGINNFGVREVLRALVDWAPPPQPREAVERVVEPAEPLHRLRVQDPGQHGPEAPRPHRLLPRLLRPLHARHEGASTAAPARR
jgi:peptide chain release factor 3